MTEEEEARGVRLVHLDASTDMYWLPAIEAAQKLYDVAEICGLDLDKDAQKPVPHRHESAILGRLVRALFQDEPAEDMAHKCARLSDRDRQVYLLRTSRAAALQAWESQPATLLGVPRDRLGTWSNLLAASWIPLPDDWVATPSD